MALTKMEFKPGRSDLLRLGPLVPLAMASPECEEWFDCTGQLDTGASSTCISPALFRKLGVPELPDPVIFHEANKEPAEVQACRAVIRLPEGTEVERDFCVLKSLGGGCDVLVGRDIMARGMLMVDFVGGHFVWFLNPDLFDVPL